MMRIRTYSDLIQLPTLEERYRYLALNGAVGDITFGTERYINQNFYRSAQWKRIRHEVAARDKGNDLGVDGMPVMRDMIIHHMNPMTVHDIASGEMHILDPEYLITTTLMTHNAIHYGDEKLLPRPFVERSAGDTKLW